MNPRGCPGAAAIFFIVGVAGCNHAARDPSPSEIGPRNGALFPSATASVRPPSLRLSNPLWQRAQGDDPLDKARLADALGAADLLEGIEDGGEIERTALLSLPYADDSEIALGRLGQMALHAPAPKVTPILEAILAIAGRPPLDREPLDPEGVRACGEALLVLASRTELSRPARGLAVSAARALAAKGLLNESRIPTDLDPE